MSFNAYGTGNTNQGRQKTDIDYAGLNKYIIETAALEQPEVLIGVVSGIVDLGIQEQQDAEIVFTGTEADEADIMDDKPSTYFKDGNDPATGKPVRLKCYPQKAIQSVAVAVDFPSVMLDKGQFFGDNAGTEKPLRMWLGGNFFSTNMRVARPTPLKIGKDSKGRWSFNDKHLFFKMAVAAKLIPADGTFLPQDIDKLVGQAFQFKAQIFNKKGKDGKDYLTEKVSFTSGLGRGQSAPDLPVDTFLVQFNTENDPRLLKEVRAHVLNTIKAAKNYEGSPIQKQLEAVQSGYTSQKNEATPESKPEETPKAEVKKPTVRKTAPKAEEDEDDKSPF